MARSYLVNAYMCLANGERGVCVGAGHALWIGGVGDGIR